MRDATSAPRANVPVTPQGRREGIANARGRHVERRVTLTDMIFALSANAGNYIDGSDDSLERSCPYPRCSTKSNATSRGYGSSTISVTLALRRR